MERTRWAMVVSLGLAGCAGLSTVDAGVDAGLDAGVRVGSFGLVQEFALLDAGGLDAGPYQLVHRAALWAAFGPAPLFEPSARCDETVVGPCVVAECSAVASTSPPDAGPRRVSAGVVTVDGLVDGGVVLPFDVLTHTYAWTSTSRVWLPQTTLALSVSGSTDVPAFGPLIIPAPSEVVTSVAACARVHDCGTVARDAPLALAWAPEPTGSLVVSLAGGPTARATCTFALDAGYAEVPVAVLGRLPSSGPPGSLSVSTRRELTHAVAGWQVSVERLNVLRLATVVWR